MVLNATFTISLSYFYRKWEWKNMFKLIQIDLHHGKWDKFLLLCTGKSFSEALVLVSVNPQYDEILFIELQEKYKFRRCCVQKCFFLFWHSKQYLYTTCSELVFFGEFNEQSLVILWVNWFKNESFWHRFTCINYQ